MRPDHPERLLALAREVGASDDLVRAAVRSAPVEVPNDYLDLMRVSNGVEGTVGRAYLQLWPLETLASRNALYEVEEFAPGLLVIGSDGGGTAYGLMQNEDAVVFVEVPFIGLARDTARIRGASFAEFVEELARS